MDSTVERPVRLDTPRALQQIAAAWAAIMAHVTWLPIITLIASVGLLQVSLANSAARVDAPQADAQFWIGILLIFVPTTLRLLSPDISRDERMKLVLVLGMGLYLTKLMGTPIQMGYHDEHAHWRTAIDIFQSGHLFSFNPLLPVTPLYPGMAIGTVTLAHLGNLDLFGSAMLLLGAMRIVMMLSLFVMFEKISGSARVAGVGVAIYATHANFLFFSAQFAYETLALPLALMFVAILVTRTPGMLSRVELATIIIVGGAITSSHHLTSYMLVMFLGLWTAITLVRSRFVRDHRDPAPFMATLVLGLMTLAWLLIVANFTLRYLYHIFFAAFDGLIAFATRGGFERMPFQSSAGETAVPFHERFFGFGSPIIAMIGLMLGGLEILRRHRNSAIAMAMLLAGLIYPGALVLRLTGGGWEISNRSAEFLFIALGLVMAVGFVKLPLRGLWFNLRQFLVLPGLVIMFVGGIVLGWSPWMRLPWPYLVVADMRSIEPQGIEAARWTRGNLITDQSILSDRINGMLLGTYGQQDVSANDQTTAGVFLWPEVNKDVVDTLVAADARYLLTDRRWSTAMPARGYYFQEWEQDIYPYTEPIPLDVVEKYDRVLGVSRVFDSGDILIYDVKVLNP